MSDDTTQPTRIDADEYEHFRQFVEDVHGQTRGHLRTEIENALREYRQNYYDAEDQLTRIENELSTLKAAMVGQDADGGVHTPEPATPAPAPDGSDDGGDDDPSPPRDHATHGQKVEYILDRMGWSVGNNVSKPAIRNIVEKTWGFGDETTQDLVDATVDHIDAEEYR